MSQVRVGRWGRNLAIRLPSGVARSSGLSEGEHVDVREVNGEIIIRRDTARARANAIAAAQAMIADSKRFTLGVSVRELLDEDRR